MPQIMQPLQLHDLLKSKRILFIQESPVKTQSKFAFKKENGCFSFNGLGTLFILYAASYSCIVFYGNNAFVSYSGFWSNHYTYKKWYISLLHLNPQAYTSPFFNVTFACFYQMLPDNSADDHFEESVESFKNYPRELDQRGREGILSIYTCY